MKSNTARIRRMLGYVAFALACMMIGSAITLAQPNAQAETQTVVVTSPFTSAIEQVRDSVVGVSNYQIVRYSNYGNNYDSFFGFGFGYGSRNRETQEQEVLSSTGSGVVIGDHFVLTNYHVVEDASSLRITVANDSGDPDEYAASLVAYDENIDIAIVYAPDLPLSPVKLGDSDSLRVGDWAICIGNPLGVQFSGTVTVGIVSSLDRSIQSKSYDKYGRLETTSNTMIQVDAAINSGNSGGGMFSVTGELMGIPTLKYTGSAYSGASVEGIGMCIPINSAKPLIEEVLSGNITVTEPKALTKDKDNSQTSSTNNTLTGKPRLGITIQAASGVNSLYRALVNGSLPNGVYIAEVEAGSPAENAGMQAGDIIVDVDDTVITSTSQLQSIIASHAEGDVLAIKVYRAPGLTDYVNGTTNTLPDGSYVDVKVTLAIIDPVKQ